MDARAFSEKWQRAELKESSAAHEHFLDLCALAGHPTPAEADPTGATFCFERGVSKQGGGDGFADVWKRDFFGWEYKGRHKDLCAAYDQLLLYRDALGNPPLLVVCDFERIVIHTNFTNTASVTHELALADMDEPRAAEILHALFFEPEKLKPGVTSQAITESAARQFAAIADSMRTRGLDPAAVAHFLNRIVFCLFAEDIGLLPDKLMTRLFEKCAPEGYFAYELKNHPERFRKILRNLFRAMATGENDFGYENIRHFNGALFNDDAVPEVTMDEIKLFKKTAELDWSAVDPSIIGTLFERGLDPAKRSQLGAHFTGREDIELLVNAIVMQPLRREWDEARNAVENLLSTGSKGTSNRGGERERTEGNALLRSASDRGGEQPVPPLRRDERTEGTRAGAGSPAQRKARAEAADIINRFLTHLQSVKVLDPACGSGNFLYVTLQRMKDLEKEVIVFAAERKLGTFLPLAGPWQLFGIEINAYAFDLAQMTVWIGWLQWIRANGFGSPPDPILRVLPGNFQMRDAIIDLTDPEHPREPEWPRVDFIVGNPPFLGGNKIRKELGDDYVDRLFKFYDRRVPAFADLCCYWYERARAHLANGGCKRAGLLATQGIRGGANREVLKRIKETGDIFFAISDKDWVLDGANVHVSLIGFDNKVEEERTLNGQSVDAINANLTSAGDLTAALVLKENLNICFMGPSPKAPFDIDEATAREMLPKLNPNKRPNSNVIRPVVSAVDLVGTSRRLWTIDFALMEMDEACQFEAPFEYVKRHVLPVRQNRRDDYRGRWWQYARPRVEMRMALGNLARFIATPAVSKHRIFDWMAKEVLCNQGTLVFARDDDWFFGILHSRLHRVWSLAMGTQLREKESGFRYTPTTCFETFPFPEATLPPMPPRHKTEGNGFPDMDVVKVDDWYFVKEPGGAYGAAYEQIATAARQLHAYRQNWLGDRSDKARTLTQLYNARPTWLNDAHRKLDEAVCAAYGWNPSLSDAEILEKLLALNLRRATPSS